MEREVRYCTTQDGVRIAYTVQGSGPPIVWPASVWADIALSEATQADTEAAVVAMGWTVIRYDGRGMGLSDREPATFSLEERLIDLKAVLSEAGAGQLALAGAGHGGMAAMAFTAANPDKVSRLLLVDAFASGAE